MSTGKAVHIHTYVYRRRHGHDCVSLSPTKSFYRRIASINYSSSLKSVFLFGNSNNKHKNLSESALSVAHFEVYVLIFLFGDSFIRLGQTMTLCCHFFSSLYLIFRNFSFQLPNFEHFPTYNQKEKNNFSANDHFLFASSKKVMYSYLNNPSINSNLFAF